MKRLRKLKKLIVALVVFVSIFNMAICKNESKDNCKIYDLSVIALATGETNEEMDPIVEPFTITGWYEGILESLGL